MDKTRGRAAEGAGRQRLAGHERRRWTIHEGEKGRRHIEQTVEALGFEVVQMERGGGRRRPLLRLRIDRPGGSERSGVTVEDCAHVTRELRAALEASGGGEGDWILEVSSPGVDRPLVKAADYERFAGRPVRVKGFEPLAGRGRRLDGTLLGLARETVLLDIEGDRVAVPLEAVASARLVHDWDAAAAGAPAEGEERG